MKPFITIAQPHKDILEGKFTMNTFAADLWAVFKGIAPAEYKDSELFFKKTFLTAGLKNIISVAEKRLKGEGGDRVIQLQTPFGGGKTHALIALYHKAKEWKANTVVIDGTVLDPKNKTIWGEIEEQLTGKIDRFTGGTPPGKEKLLELFEQNQPLLILMDELLQYATKAAGVKIVDSNLASQTLAFIHELTGAVEILEKALLVITLPSSSLEHYDENAERLFQQLQRISGRVERIYTPVQEEEIAQIIRKRLFTNIIEDEAKKIIEDFIDYAEREKILPEGVERSTYREKFKNSFPFQPEVIEILYKRWGSFPTFQRTRGVLRILALVVHSLKDSKNPFIRLGDFDLKIDDIRRELINHIGQEYDSIIASDITSDNSGAKKVDKNLGDAYLPFSFGTKVATTIFMYSFSGGPEKGATVNEIKLATAEPTLPSSIIVEAITKLRENLFYLSDAGLYFTNQPNLNRILLTKLESVNAQDLEREEKELLQNSCGKELKEYLDVYIWPKVTSDIPDTKKLKLIIVKDPLRDECKKILENCGEKPRVYRNTLIFLLPAESESLNFQNFLKEKLAWESIRSDPTLNLSDIQRKELEKRLTTVHKDAKLKLRAFYRCVLVPIKDNFKEIDLGIPTYGQDEPINKEVYERLKTDGEIVEKLSPIVLNDRYLKDKEFVETKKILETLYKTPGEIRIISDGIIAEAIREGVRTGLFGLGMLKDGNPACLYFKCERTPEFADDEIILKPEFCPTEQKIKTSFISDGIAERSLDMVQTQTPIGGNELKSQPKYHSIHLKLDVTLGPVSDILRAVNNIIRPKFRGFRLKLEILAKDGEIYVSEYEDKIKETIRQTGVSVEEENLE